MAKSGTKLVTVDLSCDVPPKYRHLLAKSGTKIYRDDLSSNISPSRGN